MTEGFCHIRSLLALSGLLAALPVAARAGGNVTVEVDDGGNLIIEGDDEDNEIWISPVEDGVGDVVGLGTTLVNGTDRASFVADDDFQIKMRGGNDRVELDDGDGNEILDDLEVYLGSGDDYLLIHSFFIHDDLEIYAGSGDDIIELSASVFVMDRTTIRTSSGDDQVLFIPSGASVPLLVFEDDFSLYTGSGRDFVNIIGARFEKDVDIDLGHDDDINTLDGLPGGLCLCDVTFEDSDVFDDVELDGGDDADGVVIESVCGIAPPGVLDDFLDDFEYEPDDCSFLGGVPCDRSCL